MPLLLRTLPQCRLQPVRYSTRLAPSEHASALAHRQTRQVGAVGTHRPPALESAADAVVRFRPRAHGQRHQLRRPWRLPVLPKFSTPTPERPRQTGRVVVIPGLAVAFSVLSLTLFHTGQPGTRRRCTNCPPRSGALASSRSQWNHSTRVASLHCPGQLTVSPRFRHWSWWDFARTAAKTCRTPHSPPQNCPVRPVRPAKQVSSSRGRLPGSCFRCPVGPHAGRRAASPTQVGRRSVAVQ